MKILLLFVASAVFSSAVIASTPEDLNTILAKFDKQLYQIKTTNVIVSSKAGVEVPGLVHSTQSVTFPTPPPPTPPPIK